VKLRATSNEVDHHILFGDQDTETLKEICRDWLDMGYRIFTLEARAEAAERVVSAARAYWNADASEIYDGVWELRDMIDAIEAYDAQRTEDDGE
jgi:hypothetical protein